MVFADIRQEWEWIKPIIKQIQGCVSIDWKAEDVYHALRSGSAQLLVGEGEDYKKGFLVVEILTNPFTLDKSLFIWLGYGDSTGSFPEKYLTEIRLLAKSLECKNILFKSNRPGFEKKPWATEIMREYQIALE